MKYNIILIEVRKSNFQSVKQDWYNNLNDERLFNVVERFINGVTSVKYVIEQLKVHNTYSITWENVQYTVILDSIISEF